MPECVGNYAILTRNGNVEGAVTLAGAGILNFLNIYVQLTSVSVSHYSVDNCQFWCRACTDQCYLYHVLSHPESDQLHYCLDNTLAELEN